MASAAVGLVGLLTEVLGVDCVYCRFIVFGVEGEVQMEMGRWCWRKKQVRIRHGGGCTKYKYQLGHVTILFLAMSDILIKISI